MSPAFLVAICSVAVAFVCRPRLSPRRGELLVVPTDAVNSRGRTRTPRQRTTLRRTMQLIDHVGERTVALVPESVSIAPRALGWTVVASVALVFVYPAAAAGSLGMGVVAGWAHQRARDAAAGRETVAECASFATLLSVAVGCGLTPRLAVEELAALGRGPLATPNRRLADSLRAGMPLEPCLRSWGASVGDPAIALAALLAGSHRDGVAAADALGEMATSLRLQQRRHAEERARRLPVTLLIPLVVCVLPAFVLLTIVPMVSSGLNGLTFPS